MVIWNDAGRDDADVLIEKKEDGALEIIATYKKGKRNYIILVGVAVAATLGAILCHAVSGEPESWIILVGIGLAVLLLWVSKHSIETERSDSLRVTEGALANLGSDVRVLRREVRELVHYRGNEDQTEGLYADRSFWKKTLLLKYVSSRQTGRIIDVIHDAHPDGWKDDVERTNNFGLI